MAEEALGSIYWVSIYGCKTFNFQFISY